MKKLIVACGVAAMMLGVASCNKSGSNNADKGFTDSLAVAIGETGGMQLLAEYNTSLPEAEKSKYKKEDILRGLKQILMTDTTSQGYLVGVNSGMQILGQIFRYQQSGINIDPNKVYEAYAKAFSADSVNDESFQAAQIAYQVVAQKAQEKMMAYYQNLQQAKQEELENSPESKENIAKGEAYLRDQMAKDSSIQTTASGLAYKVVKEGTGEPVGKNGRAVVKYKGQHIDGSVFDQNSEGVEFSPRQVVSGFGEGLAMMNEGASYILYIPGKLAYGAEGNQQAGIGANEMLVFEVEVAKIEK